MTTTATANRTLKMGKHDLELGGKYLSTLHEADDVRDDPEGQHERLKEDGYLLLRGLHDPEQVHRARLVVLENLAANGQIDLSHPLEEGVVAESVLKEGKGGIFGGGKKAITHTPDFLGLVESSRVMGFFERMLGGSVLTYDYKWLRAMGSGGFTGAHYDIVYMGRGTKNVYTLWTPLGDVPYEMGGLCLLRGSHEFERIKQTYGEMDVDRDHVAGWFSSDPVELVDRYGGQWQTTEFQAGDAIIFPMFTMHGSINNSTNRYRFSADTRYQRADEPVDERWIGDDPKAHYAWDNGKMVPMEEMRAKWAV